MPHCYSTFWLSFSGGAPLAPIWGWKDRARALPSWAPAVLAALEAAGCVDTASAAAHRSAAVLVTARALVPGLRRAWAAALKSYQAAHLPTGHPPAESGIIVHPLEALPMGAWLRLSDAERAAAIAQYAQRTPRHARIAGDRRWQRGGRSRR